MNAHLDPNPVAPEDANSRAIRDAAQSVITRPVSVVVNGTPQPITAHTLAQWVQEQGLAADALATAVNGQFVPRTLRAQQPLAEGDTIVTFQPIEGG